jgi:uncharacterized protein
MKSRSITCSVVIAALAWLGACRAAALELTPQDWATSRYETLFEKTFESPTVVRAILSPERATDPDMKTLVGIVYRIGAGVEKDLPKAAELLSAACDAGQMRGCRDYGKVLIEQGQPAQFARAADLFSRSCEAGIVFGCFDMVTAHLQGLGVEKDNAKALSYLDRACVAPAELICAEAANELAEAGLAEGLEQLDAGCAAGGMMACNNSAYFRTVSQDASLKDKGLRHAETACAGGIVDSCILIVAAKDRDGRTSPHLEQAEKQAIDACDLGYMYACYQLMYAYSDAGPPGIPADAARTFAYSSTACAYGDQESCRWTAEALEAGKGTPQDLAAAADLYHWLCGQGDPGMCQRTARIEVATASEDHPGTDVKGAVAERACELGDGESCRGIGWWHVFGEEGRQKDLALASAHFIKGCDKGAATACIDIGSLHDWAQFGFAEDKAAARAWYKRACDLKDNTGCELLAESMRAP